MSKTNENKKVTIKKEEVKQKNGLKSKFTKPVIFGILACILICIFCFAITPVTLQNDTFYTIKIGEHIVNYGVDMQDPFSWHEDLAYTYPHWLYDLLTYFVYSAFNMDGLYVATCILSCILGLSIFFVSSKLSKNKVISFFVTIGAMYLLQSYIAARAQLVTFILFTFTIYFIEKFLENKQVRYGVGLFLISLLIANLHCAVWPFFFVLFLPYIGEYLISVFSETVIYRKRQRFVLNYKIKKLSKKSGNESKIEEYTKQLKELDEKIANIKIRREKSLENPYKIRMKRNDNVVWLILVMAICVLAGFLTLIGTTPFTYLIDTMHGNTTQNINEHLPMTLATQVPVICALIIFIAILMFTKTKIKLSDLFMLGGLTYLMFVTKRQVTMFAIMGAFILAKLIVDLFNQYDKNGLKAMADIITTKVSMVLLTVIVILISLNVGGNKYKDKYVDETSYPVQACDYILENIDLSKARFYNEYNYGSYMLFRNIPVFIDSRADLYAPEFSGLDDDIFMDFIETSGLSKFYEDIFEKYDITHVITYKNSKMNMIITKTHDSNYKKLYGDDYFVVYERLNSTANIGA